METLIYEYGCRVDKDCMPLVQEQFWKAHVLYNNIIAAIRTVREDAETYLRKASHEYDDLCQRQAILDSEFKEAKAKNDEDAMKRVRSMERDTWVRIKTVRKAASSNNKEALSAIYARIGGKTGTDTYASNTAARADGLFHETANMTLEAALRAWEKVRKDGGKLNFRIASLRTTDHIDVRFKAPGGIPADEILSGRHKMMSMGESGGGSDRAGSKLYRGFRFRLGGDNYATGTWQYHRPLPTGARVTTIRLVRKRVGPDTKWFLQLQLAVPSVPTIEIDGPRKPLAAMHFGWSLTDQGTRRIAAICDEVDPGLAEFIDLPENILADLNRASMKRQERDENRDEIMAIIKVGEIDTTGWLPEHAEKLAELRRLPAQKVAAKRIAHLSRQLESADTPNALLTEWSINDHWLWQEEASIRARALNRRKNHYRELALDIVRRYETIVLSMPDLKDAALRIKDDGARNELGQIARAARNAVALYEFKQALGWAAERAATALLEAEDFSHTKVCAMCGSDVERVDDLAVCECGTTDTKANSAARLWQLWSGRFAQAAEESRRLIAEAKSSADQRKKQKQERMLAKRAEVRAATVNEIEESMDCA